MTPKEVTEAYDFAAYYAHGQSHFPDVAASLMDRVLVKLAYLSDQGRMMDAAWLAQLQPGATRILDIGCGGGDFISTLAAPGRALFGVEPDPMAREVAAARGVTVEAGTAEAIPARIAAQTFDVILMTHVLEHCADPGQALRNVRSLLAPGGGFYCEVPNCAALHFQTYAEISEMLDVPRHVHFFTAGCWSNWGSRSWQRFITATPGTFRQAGGPGKTASIIDCGKTARQDGRHAAVRAATWA